MYSENVIANLIAHLLTRLESALHKLLDVKIQLQACKASSKALCNLANKTFYCRIKYLTR